MSDCIFCKIAEKSLPSTSLYEDAYVYAFLDIHPINPGHTLVISKIHSATFLETTPEVIAHLFPCVQRIARAVKQGMRAQGVNVTINNDPAAGQVVGHFHVHIIPRFEGDGLSLWTGKAYGEGEIAHVAEKIKLAL